MIPSAEMLARIPKELQALDQWCLAAPTGAPLTAKPDVRGASVLEPKDWLSFQDAVTLSATHNLLIGFILTPSDPFACIDLDVKDSQNCPDKPELWTSREQYDLYRRVMHNFNSYTEISRGGKGLHIWCRGKIGAGVRRDGIEVYSQHRFIICTGNIALDSPIEDRQEMLTTMCGQMQPVQRLEHIDDSAEIEDDWSILLRAVSAANAEKFCSLWLGDWTHEFPSQSEADLALLSMLTFYSPNNLQVRRIFRDSGLGKREKASKNDVYLNRTINYIRNRELTEQKQQIVIEARAAQLAESVSESAVKDTIKRMESLAPVAYAAPPLHSMAANAPDGPTRHAPEVNVALAAPAPPTPQNALNSFPWPPGFAGVISKFIYSSAPRPVRQVAAVATIGLLSGICGKSWHIPQSGLNMYTILVARSAIGKEAMHSGISSIVGACVKKNPTFSNFVDFNEYASGPALIKACAANPCFVNINGEWGRKLKGLGDDQKENALKSLRTAMTNLYQKSGPMSVVGGLGYSNKENNVASVNGVAYSMIGETTPKTFYDSLTESMMEDGFMSRFLTISYDGDRPEANLTPIIIPEESLVDALCSIATHSNSMMSSRTSVPVRREDDVAKIIQKFEKECDHHINSTHDEFRRQMWNRAALKSVRLAALLAVADNYISPVITIDHWDWAVGIIRRDIANFSAKLEAGEIGTDDVSRQNKVLTIIADYMNIDDVCGKHEDLRKAGIIPRLHFQTRIARITSFGKHPQGAIRALDHTINSLIDLGFIKEVPRVKLADNFAFQGKAYYVLQLPERLW